MEKGYKTVSNLLDRGFGDLRDNQGKLRGRILHEVIRKFYTMTLKTADRRNKMNYRDYSQRIRKAKVDILSEIEMNEKSKIYRSDVQFLLDALENEIRLIGKPLAKDHYNIITPEEIEKALLGGEAYFEEVETEQIGGLSIRARHDCLIELDNENFIVRDFKSCERDLEEDPIKPDSKYHRHFMQVCLYAIIFEKARTQTCKAVQIQYFPKDIINYHFTEELRRMAEKFALDSAFEGFKGISLNLEDEVNDSKEDHKPVVSQDERNESKILDDIQIINNQKIEEKCLGWINTIPGKPLQIIRGKPNKIEGYLYTNVASQVRDNSLLKVDTNEGIILGCRVEKIECYEESASTVTKTHKEQSYCIILNPEVEITPEGCCSVRPQTIISGKIKKLTEQEYYLYKNIPQNGMQFGTIEGLLDETCYRLNLRLLFQSCFVGGVQNTGKTSMLKYLIMIIAQQENNPSQIIFDAEEEYIDLIDIPTNPTSKKIMLSNGINSLDHNRFNIISINSTSSACLTMKSIDPLDLPLFLHELTSITHSTLQRIIKDILTENPGKHFTLPELKQAILRNIDLQHYRLNPQTKSAIERALMPISLDMFDKPGGTPIDIEAILKSGKITIFNCFDASDEEQRIIALFLLCALHKYKMKKKKDEHDSGVLFYLDEVQRLLPKILSNSDNQKRIIHYLGEIHHRGRKRKYGVIYATQSPLDIKKEIIDLCNTKVFFQIQGDASNLLKEYLNKEERERLRQLPIGQAFITSKGKHEPVEINFPYLN